MLLKNRILHCVLNCAFAWALLSFTQPAAALPLNVSANFSGADYGTADMSLVNGGGSGAFWVTDPGISPPFGLNERLRVSSNSSGQRGNAWYNPTTVVAAGDWTFDFTMQITYPTGSGADGMAFHMQEIGVGADTFIQGQGLGADFLSVTFDTYNNFDSCSVDFGLAVFNNGSQVGSCVDLSGVGSPDPYAYSVGLAHNEATGNLSVTVTNTNSGATTGALNYTVDLSALDTATFGWSAQTGGDGENHDVVNFDATFAIPEPSTALLLGLGLAGLAVRRQRIR
jgi:hypothetical protein